MIVYTDGACAQNAKSTGQGGYGVVVLDDNENLITTYSHKENNTTNNRQEMKAIIWALVHYGKRAPLIIYSDSAYAVNTFSSWMYNWAANGWIKSNNKTPENLDLVQAYYNLIQKGYKCELLKVKGHSGNKWNEIADDLATGRITATWNMN